MIDERWNVLSEGRFVLRDICAFDIKIKGPRFSPPLGKGRITSAFFMIRKGSAVYSYDGGEFDVEEGDLVFIPRGSNYTFTPKQPGLIHSLVNFDIYDESGEYIYLSDHPEMLIKSAGKGYALLIDELEKCFMYRAFSGHLRSASLVMQIFANYLEDCNKERLGYVGYERIIPAITFLEQNCNVNVTTQELAEMCNMSESQLRRLFHGFSGTSPTEYRNRLRIQKAYEMLKNNYCNVTEAAHSVGFTNIYYFSRLFKSVIGVSPKSVQTSPKS